MVIVLVCCYPGLNLSCQGDRCKEARERQGVERWGADDRNQETDEEQVDGKDDKANFVV